MKARCVRVLHVQELHVKRLAGEEVVRDQSSV